MLNFHFPAILSYWNNCKINYSHKKAASNPFMTIPVYELHERIRPTGKIFKYQHLNLCSSQLAKAQSRSETLQVSKLAMLHEKVTFLQGNIA